MAATEQKLYVFTYLDAQCLAASSLCPKTERRCRLNVRVRAAFLQRPGALEWIP